MTTAPRTNTPPTAAPITTPLSSPPVWVSRPPGSSIPAVELPDTAEVVFDGFIGLTTLVEEVWKPSALKDDKLWSSVSEVGIIFPGVDIAGNLVVWDDDGWRSDVTTKEGASDTVDGVADTTEDDDSNDDDDDSGSWGDWEVDLIINDEVVDKNDTWLSIPDCEALV